MSFGITHTTPATACLAVDRGVARGGRGSMR